MKRQPVEIGQQAYIENQSDGSLEGPYKVVDIGVRNDFLAGGLVNVAYLQEPKPNLDPALVDFPTNAWKSKAIRAIDKLQAFTYPLVWCWKAEQNESAD